MRRKITLYIADREVDLSEDALVLMNYTFEDLTNPTIVKNSYSKTITLAGTPNNNEVFGNIWRLDRRTLLSETPSAGIAFNATQKTPFRIFNEMSEVIVSGYCKLDGINRSGADIKYKVSLYGGLGSFFYNLSYNEDGSKKTLADLAYHSQYGYLRYFGAQRGGIKGTEMYAGAKVVADAWDFLKRYIDNPSGHSVAFEGGDMLNVINFAPCYNGIPADFDADKAIVPSGRFANIPPSINEDGKTFTTKNGVHLVKLPRKMTEWETRDLRWYLQRPVIRFREVLKAIQEPVNNGGYEVAISSSILDSDIVKSLWLTLPTIATADRKSGKWAENTLKASFTPADYLLSFCKMYGYVFVTDLGKKRVKIKSRSEFFSSDMEVIDLSERIDTETMTITPNVANHRFYQMGGAKPVIGEWAKEYGKDFGREYGIQRINTGYDFDLETTILTKDAKVLEGCDVCEGSNMFFTANDFSNRYSFPPSAVGDVKVTYWYGSGENEETKEVSADPYLNSQDDNDNRSYPGSDWLPKVQFHEKDNKAVKGENVFLFFNGSVSVPNFLGRPGFVKFYAVTDDTDAMLQINANKPCWAINKLVDATNTIQDIPCFLRDRIEVRGGVLGRIVRATTLYGDPLARGTLEIVNPDQRSIYGDYWNAYLTDRYDVDTKVMRCKADLRGLAVSQELLGRFFFYGGSLWVLNKIEDFSLTTDDLTKCEFIKVKDIQNYTK